MTNTFLPAVWLKTFCISWLISRHKANLSNSGKSVEDIIHSFIRSGYLYSASSNPLLLGGAPDTALTQSEFHAEAPRATASEGLASGRYVAARTGFEPTTLRTEGDKSTNEPPRPTF